jgi:hypothetical protein
VRKNDEGSVNNAEQIGGQVGAALLAAGAHEILQQVHGAPARDSAV